MQIRFVSIIAGGATALGIAVGIFTSSPSQWTRNLFEWSELLKTFFAVFWPALITILGIAMGLLAGRYLIPDSRRGLASENIIDESKFSDVLAKIISQNTIYRIDVLSYTSETLSDVLKYDYRNKDGITFRILSRHWIEEACDEEAYNMRISSTAKRRRWNKSEFIKTSATLELCAEVGDGVKG